MERSYTKELKEKEGQNTRVSGWVDTRRDHGKIIFFDLRDTSGLLQVVVTPKQEEAYNIASNLSSQDVVSVQGKISKRPEQNINPEMDTGTIELAAEKIQVVGKSEALPIPIEGDGYDIEEAQRFKYRYIDLRRQRLQENLKLRHQAIFLIREFLINAGFIEVETPYLSKTTPEGARDFIVPSRLQKGKFYALAQAPQQYKQLLMISGVEKYFQVARAFRDEDLRADRQFEHTQIDIEQAFVEQEDILKLVEGMYIYVAEKLGKKVEQKPFPRFSYKEAIEKFGEDKFDLRKEKDKDNLAFAFVVDFPLFERDQRNEKWTFSHNPFTAPKPEGVEKLMKEEDLENILSLQYDLVCNGHELGSGSIRIHDPKVQRKVFEVMGYSNEEIESTFGHILNAYNYGAPTHGGIGLGLDRFVALLAGEENIREVIAFPVTSTGQTSVMDAPSNVSEDQLRELGLSIEKKPDKQS